MKLCFEQGGASSRPHGLTNRSGNRRARVTATGFLMLLLCLVMAIPADAILPGRNGRIAFTSGREGPNDNDARIYLREFTCTSAAET